MVIKVGDTVRVLSLEELRATLEDAETRFSDNEFKTSFCSDVFMEDMASYCGQLREVEEVISSARGRFKLKGCEGLNFYPDFVEVISNEKETKSVAKEKVKIVVSNRAGESNKIAHIKLVRELTGVGLKDAKVYVDEKMDCAAIEHTFIISMEQFGFYCLRNWGKTESSFPAITVESFIQPSLHDLSELTV